MSGVSQNFSQKSQKAQKPSRVCFKKNKENPLACM